MSIRIGPARRVGLIEFVPGIAAFADPAESVLRTGQKDNKYRPIPFFSEWGGVLSYANLRWAMRLPLAWSAL